MYIPIQYILGIIVLIVAIFFLYPQTNRFTQRRTQAPLSKKVFSGTETHGIVIIDDDVTSMDDVVRMLGRVIDISEEQAINLMLRIHEEGIAIVWTGDRNTAEQHFAEIQHIGMQCFLMEIETQ